MNIEDNSENTTSTTNPYPCQLHYLLESNFYTISFTTYIYSVQNCLQLCHFKYEEMD